jgi:hypothetical protein
MTRLKGNPNFKPKTPAEALADKVTEFRVRGATKADLDGLLIAGKILRRRTIPDIIRALIAQFPNDQFTIKEQGKRLNDLHKRLADYQAREAAMVKLIVDFMRYTDQWNKATLLKSRGILKKFTAAPKGKGGVK